MPNERFNPTISILFLCFIFQQFGINFHLSFGSLGFAILLFGFRCKIRAFNPLKILLPLTLGTISFAWVLLKYGYADEIGRFARYMLCLSAIIFLLDEKTVIKHKSITPALIAFTPVCVFLWFQIIFDKSLQIPSQYYAMGENLADGGSASEYAFHADQLRGNGIYSEPSYFGMVAVCLLAITLRSQNKFRTAFAVLLSGSILLSGSGLGIFGLLSVIILSSLERGYIKANILSNSIKLIIICAIFYFVAVELGKNYEFTFLERLSSSRSEGDGSTETRLITPYYLVLEGFANGDFFGVPVQTYAHYLYTGLYTDVGEYPGHNGLWSLIFQFGIFGFALIAYLFKRLLNPLEFFIFIIILSQNGNVLTYEKVLSVVFVISILRGSQCQGQSILSAPTTFDQKK